MKPTTLLIALLLAATTFASAQDIQPAPANKAVVYFVRASSDGFLINFSYFDSASMIGIFAGKGYIRYECTPGKHIFWARSENKDYVEANLEAGKIYFINAIVQMGLVKAQVMLAAVDGKNPKKMKGLLKLLAKNPPMTMSDQDLKAKQEEFKPVIDRGLKEYYESRAGSKKTDKLNADMCYTK